MMIHSKKDDKEIWVPPKAVPTLPFGLGPAPKPVLAEDFKKTTYPQHEMEILKEAATQLAMSVGISMFVSMKFQIHISLLIQCAMLPLTIYENILFKKYVLGVKKAADGGLLYGEYFKAPTAESLAQAQRVSAALAAAAAADENDNKTVPSVARSSIPKGEPRVEELPDDDTKPAKKSYPAAVKKEEDSSVHNID